VSKKTIKQKFFFEILPGTSPCYYECWAYMPLPFSHQNYIAELDFGGVCFTFVRGIKLEWKKSARVKGYNYHHAVHPVFFPTTWN